MTRKPILALLAVIGISLLSISQVSAQLRDWNTRYGDWSDATNWNPGIIPGLTDLVRIGNLASAYDADVALDMHTAVGGLQIYDGMRLQTNGFSFATVGDTLITGSGTRSSELEVVSSSYSTRDLTNEARLRLSAGQINVSRMLNNEGNIFGGGTINLARDAGIAFRNDGTIFSNGAALLAINQLGTGLMDLDGTTGNGYIRHAAPWGTQMEFNGTELADSFSGRIDLGTGNTLSMNFSGGWVADANSEINFLGWHLPTTNGVLAGGDWTLNGTLNVRRDPITQGNGDFTVAASTIIGSSASILIESQNSLAFNHATIQGGTCLLEEDASLAFDGNVYILGGEFTTYNNQHSSGSVEFNGQTAWDGDVNVNGILRQNGNAVVVGSTTIDAGVLDMDGNGNAHWTISSDLTINADGVDSTLSNSFDGSMLVGGAFGPRLTINLNDPEDSWTMAGEMDLQNGLGLIVNRVAGSEMRVTGDLNLDGWIGIQSDLHLDNPAVISFANASDRLLVQGDTFVAGNATFLGDGELINSVDGHLTLGNGLTLDDVSLSNHGVLDIDEMAGIVDVARYNSYEHSEIHLDIGGDLAGTAFDVLMVGEGPATLDGEIHVDLIDVGMGLFLPEVGDEFTVIMALGGIFGTFENDPTSMVGNVTYHWQVQYNTHDVTLLLANVSVPEPGAVFLPLVVLGTLGLRRRRG